MLYVMEFTMTFLPCYVYAGVKAKLLYERGIY